LGISVSRLALLQTIRRNAVAAGVNINNAATLADGDAGTALLPVLFRGYSLQVAPILSEEFG